MTFIEALTLLNKENNINYITRNNSEYYSICRNDDICRHRKNIYYNSYDDIVCSPTVDDILKDDWRALEYLP